MEGVWEQQEDERRHLRFLDLLVFTLVLISEWSLSLLNGSCEEALAASGGVCFPGKGGL